MMKTSSATIDLSHPRGFEITALAALFVLTLRQHLRGRRLWVLMLLFLLPSLLVVLVRLTNRPPPPEHLEFAFVFNLIPHVLATLTALLYAAGIIQDEIEEQTLTYLLIRPLPRWALYLTKLAVTIVVTSTITAAFTALAYIVIYWNTDKLWGEVLTERVPKAAALFALAQVGYCSLFGAVSMLTRRSLIAGLAYIVAFEGILANFASVVRQLTVMFYFRVLAVRWLNPADSKGWSIDLDTAPSALSCVEILLVASLAFAVIGAALMVGREFRVKTPEGS
ncbi:MAG TPA: ABC transporter permease subunit [Gemmataceae bacterium]|nr:ABC transporter permease subunit [Gemmataceae bacterium]